MSEVKRPEFPTICFETDTQEAMRQADAYMDHLEAENQRLRKALAELIDLYESVFREEEELPELDDYRAALQESGTGEDT